MSEKDPDQEDIMRAAFEFAAEASAEPDSSEMPTLDLGAWKPPELAAIDAMFPGYDFHRILGPGGMGVAIKIMSPELAKIDSSFVTRFQREAKAMAQLDHPNIVTVFDFGKTEEGHCYFVMEFVDGADFHQLIQSGGLNTKSALEAVGQICDALEYAHDKGFVHRDIKPANIFINQEHRIKVGDFGLAKLVKGEEESAAEESSLLTRPGSVMGTPWYSAPEQLSGGEVDQRADIYSLGVMFYEMLTGEVPRGAVSPPSRRVQLDIRLDEVVLRAMADQPEARYQTVAEVRTDVDEIRTTPPATGPEPARENKAGKSPVAFIVVFAALIMGGAGWFAWHEFFRSDVDAGKKEKITVSPRGTSTGDGNQPMALKSIAGGNGRPVLVDLVPGNDVEFSELPDNFDGVTSAATLTDAERTSYFVRKDGTLWFWKWNVRMKYEASAVRKVVSTFRPYALRDDGSVIRPSYSDRGWIPHHPGPFLDVEPGVFGILIGIDSNRKMVPIPEFETASGADPKKAVALSRVPHFENVRQIHLGMDLGIAIDREGYWKSWSFSNVEPKGFPAPSTRLLSAGLGPKGKALFVTSGGRLQYSINPAKLTLEARSEIESTINAEAIFRGAAGQPQFAVRLKGNRWRLFIQEEGEPFRMIDPAITDALEGCTEVAISGELAIGLRDLPEKEVGVGEPAVEGSQIDEPEPSKATSEQLPAPVPVRLQSRMKTNEVPVDFSRAEGIDDFVQVIAVEYPGSPEYDKGGWVALRSNGRIVSSTGLGEDLENVTRLIECRHSFGAILEDGSVIYYGSDKQAIRWNLAPGERALDAALGAGNSLCILEDKSLQYRGYRGGRYIPKQWPLPPAEAQEGPVRCVGVTDKCGFALTEAGQLFVWDKRGTIPLPTALESNIEDAVAYTSTQIAVLRNGEFRIWDFETGSVESPPKDFQKAENLQFRAGGLLIKNGGGGRRVFLRGQERLLEKEINRTVSQIPSDQPVSIRHDREATQIYTIANGRLRGWSVIPDRAPVSVQGRLRAWASPESDLQFDVSKAEGIDDFVQVVQFVSRSGKQVESADWAALRADGKIVSSDGRGESVENVVKLIPGAISFGAITEQGQAIYFGGGGPQTAPLEAGERAVDGAFAGSHGLVILEDRSLKYWGDKYEGANAWPEPPIEVLSAKIAHVQASGLHALAVTESGDLFVWGEDGQIDLPEPIRTGIDELDGPQMSGFAVRKGGSVWNYVITQRKLHRYNLPDGEPVTRLHPQARIHHLLEGADGSFHFPVGSFEALSERLTQLPKNARHAAAAVDRFGKRVEMLLYIEPVAKGDAGSPAPVQGRLLAWTDTKQEPVDLSRAEGYTDFVDVVLVNTVTKTNWFALRANGQLVSNHGYGEELDKVEKLTRGNLNTCGAICRDGSLHIFKTNAEKFEPSPLKEGSRVAQAWTTSRRGLVIYEDGRFGSWGWPEPPDQVATSRIVSITSNLETAFAVTEKRNLFRWSEQGEIEVPESIRSGVDQVVYKGGGSFFVRKGDRVYLFDKDAGRVDPVVLQPASPIRRLHFALDAPLLEYKNGSLSTRHKSYEPLRRRLELLKPGLPFSALARGKDKLLLHIEPVAEDREFDEPVPTNEAGKQLPAPVQGRLHAWMKTGDAPIDLSKAEGIDDFVQVISVDQTWDEPKTFGWAALRSDGSVVSSSGVGEELKDVAKLIEARHSFGAILKDGSVLWYENNGSKKTFQPIASGERVIEAAVQPINGLAILEDRSLRHWGTRYHDSNPNSWPPPPDEALRSKIRDVGVTPEYAFALTEIGALLVWGDKVAAVRPDEIQQGVDQAVPVDNHIIGIRKEGTVSYFYVQTGEVVPFPDSLPPIKNIKSAFQGILMEGVNGERIFRSPTEPGKSPLVPDTSISDRISGIPKNEPYAVRCNHSDPVRQVYSIEDGQLRGWSRHPERSIDMSLAEGITDFIDVVFMKGDIHQVIDAPFAWAALRANGEVIISDGCEETLGDVTRLLPGPVNFSVIRKDGSVHCYDPKARTFSPTPLDGSEPVRDAWVFRADSGIAILENGELRDWGNRSEPPRQVRDSQIVRATANLGYALAVSSDGKLFGWGAEGELEVPEVLRQGIDDVVLMGGSDFLVRKDQISYTYDCRLGTHRIFEQLEHPVRKVQKAGQSYVVEKPDGKYSLLTPRFPDLQSRLENLDQGIPFSASAHAAGRVEILMHIEPVTSSTVIPGSVQGWSGNPDRPLDLTNAAGIDDFVQVIPVHEVWKGLEERHWAWAGLRANGQIVGNGNYGEDLRDIVKLEMGVFSSVAIRKDGKLFWLDSEEGRFVPAPLPDGAKVKRASVLGNSKILAILEGGALVTHGRPGFPTSYANEKFIQVSSSARLALALTESGELICWRDEGVVELPETIRTGVRDITYGGGDNFHVLKGDRVYTYYYGREISLAEHSTQSQSSIRRLHNAGNIPLTESISGQFTHLSGNFPVLKSKLEQLSPGTSFSAIAQGGDHRPGIEMLLSIKPKEAGK
ncbi:MAG: serine/threonine-protein kinase [Verrucomicrobiales bacterium]|nr:serine/threonine-protein kinase [Verrucomicrobiales bacterium]